MSEKEIRQIVREESKRFENRIIELEKENYKLNSILTELERALKDHKEIKEKTNTKEYYIEVDEVLDKIQELKEKYK